MKILIVEDDKCVRDVLTLILKKENFTVDNSPDGSQAVERIRENGGYRLIITDVNMPVMDGFAFSLEAKKLLPKTKIMGMSGGSISSVKANKHFDLFIRKPFDADQFVNAVNCALNDGKSKSFQNGPSA
ncbi:response regulator [bacterium]|nr:response regulator [bacterium]